MLVYAAKMRRNAGWPAVRRSLGPLCLRAVTRLLGVLSSIHTVRKTELRDDSRAQRRTNTRHDSASSSSLTSRSGHHEPGARHPGRPCTSDKTTRKPRPSPRINSTSSMRARPQREAPYSTGSKCGTGGFGLGLGEFCGPWMFSRYRTISGGRQKNESFSRVWPFPGAPNIQRMGVSPCSGGVWAGRLAAASASSSRRFEPRRGARVRHPFRSPSCWQEACENNPHGTYYLVTCN